eukprot:CAMPEP_0180621560 /NCGR_PEP_ID=MMETSP1037_2-20121125/35210_1 /TAXON_ID=632150 /ORGANISM="Azadinium spinosum, Strain 3D9" /LENGTH=316 /DNA_ID=CAMNT_0022641737 /DNA_START=39 /DNA_END=986 /DNA_ORIENTATION=+
MPPQLYSGVETLLLQGRRHRGEDDGLGRTISLLQGEVLPSVPLDPTLGANQAASPSSYFAAQGPPKLWLPPLRPEPPAVPPAAGSPSGARSPRARAYALLRGPAVHPRPRQPPALPPLTPAERHDPTVRDLHHERPRRNLRDEAMSSLTSLLKAFRNKAEYSSLLTSYYRGAAPAHGLVLADWLSSRPQNSYLWSRMHHKVRWRSRRRHFSLLKFADAHVPSVDQASRMVTYVKAWMGELDDQESMRYKSDWLRLGSNRGNLARFFRLAANCTLMAHYLEEVLVEPRPDLIVEANRALTRIDRAVGELRGQGIIVG